MAWAYSYTHTHSCTCSPTQAELIAIAKGEVESKRHRVFVSGTGRERENLKREGAFGPLMKWKQGKVRLNFYHVKCSQKIYSMYTLIYIISVYYIYI